MITQRAAYGLAYAEDIPGSRCGPEDGPWPRSYQILHDPELTKELVLLAKPQSLQLDSFRRADSINFQPCPRARTQDRYVVRQLNVQGRLWTLTGVFDGHLGDTTVEHVAHHLPIIVVDALRRLYDDLPYPSRVAPTVIKDLLSRSIVAFDNAIAEDVLSLFPGGVEGLSRLSDRQIRSVINDQFEGGTNYTKARLCMYGTTALVTLVDPDHENVWVANVGDCQAVMVTPDAGDRWKVEVLTTTQNGDNDSEVDRVRREHPGEDECVMDRRVLGALAPFRCLGDVPFKQPPEFTRRILYNLLPGFHDVSPWEEFLLRNRTPPYITAEPEVIHRRLEPLPSYFTGTQRHAHVQPARFLVSFSDGFSDLCSGRGLQSTLSSWAQELNEPPKAAEEVFPDHSIRRKADNMALRLLRHTLGGDDHFSISQVLTLDMDVAWIDDTAIVVQTL